MKEQTKAAEKKARGNREKRLKNFALEVGDTTVIVLVDRRKEVVGVTGIDTEDYQRVKKHRWYLNKAGYAFTGSGHPFSLASLILGVKTDRYNVIDHINQNKLDNRKHNLRVVSRSINAFNAKIRKDNTSGHPGVSWDSARRKWTARICVGGKVKCLGRFAAIESAIMARKSAEVF